MAPSLVLGVSEDLRMLISMKDVADDTKTADYVWMLTWHDDKATNEDYWVRDLTQEEMHEKAIEFTKDCYPGFTDMIKMTPASGMLKPLLVIKDMMPQEIPLGRVTLVGDAAHPMTPCKLFAFDPSCQN